METRPTPSCFQKVRESFGFTGAFVHLMPANCDCPRVKQSVSIHWPFLCPPIDTRKSDRPQEGSPCQKRDKTRPQTHLAHWETLAVDFFVSWLLFQKYSYEKWKAVAEFDHWMLRLVKNMEGIVRGYFSYRTKSRGFASESCGWRWHERPFSSSWWCYLVVGMACNKSCPSDR